MNIENVKKGQRVTYPSRSYGSNSHRHLAKELYNVAERDTGVVVRKMRKDEWSLTDKEDGVYVRWDSNDKVEPVSVSAIDLEDEEVSYKDALKELAKLTDSLSNNDEAWRGPEQALIRILEQTLGELIYFSNKRRVDDDQDQ